MKRILFIVLSFAYFVSYGQNDNLGNLSVHGLFNKQEKQLGVIYQKNTWADTSDFSQSGGIAISLVSSKLHVYGGTAGNYTKTLTIKGDTSCLYRWKFAAKVKLDSLNSDGAFFGIGMRSVNTTFTSSIMARVGFAAASPSTSQALVDIIFGGTPSNVYATNAANKLSASTGDYILLTLEQTSPITITVTERNLTTASSLIDSTYTVPISSPTSQAPNWHNTSVFSFFSQGVGYTIDSLSITSPEMKNASIACVGDSKTLGAGAVNIFNDYVNQLSYQYKSVVNLGGSGDKTSDVLSRVQEIINLNPKQVLLNIGRNDLANSISTGVWEANYDSIVAKLLRANIDVIHLLPFYETNISQTTLYSFIEANFPAGKIIDTYDVGNIPGSLYSDNVHPSDSGYLYIAQAIVQSGLVNESKPYFNPNITTTNAASTLDAVLTAGNTSTNQITLSAYKTNTWGLNLAGTTFQDRLLNASLIMDNGYYNGSAFTYIQTGFFSGLYFLNGEIGFMGYPSASAGTTLGSTINNKMWFAQNGSFGLGGLQTTFGSPYTGANLIGLSTGKIQFTKYGSGTFTGTATEALNVDASGNIIEGTLGGSATLQSATNAGNTTTNMVAITGVGNVPASGAELEEYFTGGTGYVGAYNRGTSAALPLIFSVSGAFTGVGSATTPVAFLDVMKATASGASIHIQPSGAVDPTSIFRGMLWDNGTNLYYGTGSGTKVDLLASGSTNIYNTDGTLTANRTLSAGGFNLSLGATGSKLTSLTINSSAGISTQGQLQYGIYQPGDANITVPNNVSIVELPIITANRTITLPTMVAGSVITFYNTNTSNTNQWSFTNTVSDANGYYNISTLRSGRSYDVLYDGTGYFLKDPGIGYPTQTLFTQTATVTVANSSAATSLIGAGVGSMTVPANFFSPGKTIRIKVAGVYGLLTATPGNLTVNLKIGSTTIATGVISNFITTAPTNQGFAITATVTCRTTGAGGTVMTDGMMTYENNATSLSPRNDIDLNNAGATSSVNTTGSLLIDCTIQWATANAANTISATSVQLESIN